MKLTHPRHPPNSQLPSLQPSRRPTPTPSFYPTPSGIYPVAEFAALLVTSGVALEPSRVMINMEQPTCSAPILVTQFQQTGFFFSNLDGNNVPVQVTATCSNVTSTFACEISRLSKNADGEVQETEGYYCFSQELNTGYLLVTYNPDRTNNTQLFPPGTEVVFQLSSENPAIPLNEYILYARPTSPPSMTPSSLPTGLPSQSPSSLPTTTPSFMPTFSPTVPVGTGDLIPAGETCPPPARNWIAVAHSRNGSQLAVLDQGTI